MSRSSWGDAYESATDVFIGRVIASPTVRDAGGVIRPNPARSLQEGTLFGVDTRFKGNDRDEMLAMYSGGGSDCLPEPFVQGETHLVIGTVYQGQFFVSLSAPRVALSVELDEPTRREVVEALKYFATRARNRPIAYIHGSIHPSWNLEEREAALAGDVRVHGRRTSDGLTTIVRIPNNESHGYQLVVPPGEHVITILRDGQPLGPSTTVALSDGDIVNLSLHPGGWLCVRKPTTICN